MRLIVGGLALAVLATPAAAASPSFDCANADGDVETLVCSDDALAALDRRLADRFADAVATVRGLDAGSEAALDELRAVQRGWVKGRNDCWKAADVRACVADAYLSREGELVARYILEPPTDVTSWICDDGPAYEVVVSTFATERPSIRIEVGDSVDTGTLVPMASGTRYDASFGRFFWSKGGSAMFAWQPGIQQPCEAAP
jgi:uncharacterized protein